MVAPLDVDVVVLRQRVHDEVRALAPVVDIAQDVQAVDGEPLDEVAQGGDELVGAVGGDDGADDAVEVVLLVVAVAGLVEQFLDDVGELAWQGLAHLRAGVLRRHVAADGHQAVERRVVEVLQVGLGLLDKFQFLLGVVDEGADVLQFLLAQRAAEEVAHLALDVAAGVAQHVLEGRVLAVEVGHKMLGGLGQVEDGLKVDDFGGHAGHVGKLARQELQVS